MSGVLPPPGFTRFDEPRALIVARDDVAVAVIAAYRSAPRTKPTLHGFASQSAGARPLQGREIAYALTLPGSSVSVVVRHNRHGGALRHLTADLFLGATRAPTELAVAIRVQALGIPTPAVVAYGIYPAAPGLARSDVLTEETMGGSDLGEVLIANEAKSEPRRNALRATGRLLEQLAVAGVRHSDLNVKNILIRPGTAETTTAVVLDVDRITFGHEPAAASERNIARLMRSISKWYGIHGGEITARDIALLAGYHRRLISATTSS